MKTIAIDIQEIDVQHEVNGFKTTFYIRAIACLDNEEGKNNEILSEFDGSNVNSARNITPFNTVIFPNTERVYRSLQHAAEMFTRYFNDLDDYVNGKIDVEPKKPCNFVFYLNRFEVTAPVPYFQKFTTDTDDHKAGDWILASDGDTTMEGDELKRKLFTVLYIVSVVKKDEKDANGNDIPVENLERKAKRIWEVGIVPSENGKRDFPIYYDAARQLESEARLKAAKVNKETDDMGIETPIQRPTVTQGIDLSSPCYCFILSPFIMITHTLFHYKWGFHISSSTPIFASS